MSDAIPVTTFGLAASEDNAPAFGSVQAMRMKAVSSILREHGLTPANAASYLEMADDPSLEGTLQHLRSHGLFARRIEVAADELESLRLPTLLQLRSHALVMLWKVGARHVVIGDDRGTRIELPRWALADRATGIALDVSFGLATKGSFVVRVLGLLARHHRLLLKFLLFSTFATGLSLLAPTVSRLVLDRAIPGTDRGLLTAAVLGMCVIGLHQAFLQLLSTRVWQALAADVEVATQHRLFDHSLSIAFAEAQRRNPGSFLATLSVGGGLTDFFVHGLLLGGVEAVRCAAFLVNLAFELPLLALLAACVTGVAALLLLVIGRKVMLLQRDATSAGARERSRMLEIFDGILTLKALGAERRSQRLWQPDFVKQRQLAIARGKTEVWLHFLLKLTDRIVLCLVVLVAGSACLNGRLSLGGFLSASMLATGFSHGAIELLSSVLPLYALGGGLRAVDQLLALPARPERRPEPTDVHGGGDAIVFDDVWFRYEPETPWVLKGVSLRIERGSYHPLRGESGSGKTTMLRLISGLLRPTRGSVRVLGCDPEATRGLCAYLPQDPRVLSGSILSNLRTLSGADLPEIRRAAAMTGFAEVVARLPMQYETILTAGGTDLSGGERQLLLLTAASASSRDKILLLDESTAHLDPVTRAKLNDMPAFAGRTIVSVVHDA